jgi:Cu-Zn family superoxide dismutase
MNNFRVFLVMVLLGLATLVACAPKEEAPVEPPAEAVLELVAVAKIRAPSDGLARGVVFFTQEGSEVVVEAEVEGVEPGSLGIHLHELGDCSAPDFTSAGGHFNPTGVTHGAPTDPEHHAGDFGNIEIGEDGTGFLELTTTMLTVAEGPNTVVGRAVILHEKADDLTSQPTGAAGGRIACGVVELAAEEPAEAEPQA